MYWWSVAALYFLVLSSSATRADEGVIEFSDKAPPPTEAENTETRVWEARVKVTADAVSRLATALRATLRARDAARAAGALTTQQLAGLAASRDAFMAASDQLVDQDLVLGSQLLLYKLNLEAMAEFVPAALSFAAALAALPPGPTVEDSEMVLSIGGVLERLSRTTDLLIGENALLNDGLLHHPHLGTTQLLGCADVNAVSQAFRCAPADATGTIGDAGWAFGPVALEEFCRTKSSAIDGGRLWVARTALDQSVVIEALDNAVLWDHEQVEGAVRNDVLTKAAFGC